jgi:hypothetical protein
MPVTVGKLFPASDVVARWMFNLSALTDDLAIIDDHLRGTFDDDTKPALAYFRLIITRLYEGRRLVKEMDDRAAITSFVLDLGAADATALLRRSYIRPPGSSSVVETTYARARHLTVHYPSKPGELARILRDARDLDAGVRVEHGRSLRYLWPQAVIEHALWPTAEQRRNDIELAAALTQAFVDVFVAAMPAHLERVGFTRDDLTRIER